MFGTSRLKSNGSLVVGDDVHGSLLCAGGAAVNAHITTDKVGLHVRPDTPIRLDKATSPFLADLSIVEDFFVLRRIRIGLGYLVCKPLIQRLVLTLTDQCGVALGRRIALVEHIVNAAIDQGVFRLNLVQLL